MNAIQKMFAYIVPAAFVFVGFCTLIPGRLIALSGEGARAQSSEKIPIRISVQDKNGVEIARTGAGDSLSSAPSTVLAFEHEYQPGDHIILRGPRRMAVRLDQNMPECLLYLQNSSQGNFDYEIPIGRAEQQTGSAYSPDSFSGRTHRMTARVLNGKERAGYRNLALNPCDLLHSDAEPASVFPHASTNSFARNLFDFAARNAIDGVALNGHHGIWPYQSWGPELRQDLWWKLDFGRPVELDKIRLMVRADFPHDSYWKSAVVEFSDGSQLPIQINSSAEFQEFSFPKRKISSFRLIKLVPVDPEKWCSFIEVEAWGHDSF
jgi:hypothetical protein